MHLLINALAASAGGGVTYLRNVLPHLSARTQIRTTVLAGGGFPEELGELPRVFFPAVEPFSGQTASRFWREQKMLPSLIRRCGCDVLISTGNMALFRSPVPQILLSRNALYTSPEFYSDAWARKQWGLWLRTHIQGLFAKWSIPVSDRVVAPSGAFAVEIRAWLDGRSPTICTIPHGFDRTLFFGDDRPLPEEMQRLLSQDESCLRLLFVSHYNYFRNFDTLVRALPLIKKRLEGRCIKLILTCRLRPAAGRGRYDVSQTRELVRRLGVGGDIMELDQVPYPLLHKVYRACDMYVTPSYAESFAHPLVEAMACGLPVVASDLAVHREVCADAALYFPRFSPECLAEQVAGIAGSRDLAREMAVRGLARSRNFSWKKHVSELVALAAQLVDGCRPANPPVVNREIEAAAMQTPACTAEGQRK